MKANFKLVSGTIELSDQDVLSILREYALPNQKALNPIISNYITEKWGYIVDKIKLEDNLTKISVTVSGGFNPSNEDETNIVSKPKLIDNTPRVWNGLYKAVGSIIEKQRKRDRRKISFEDLHSEMLEIKDEYGNQLFVQDGFELPIQVLKQRLAPSQIIRQSKRQKNLKGVTIIKHKRKNEGLSF